MLAMLKTKVAAFGASAVGLGAVITLSSLLGAASYNDALGYYGWIDASQVPGAVPGQLYVISEQNEIREPLCSLTPNDFAAHEQPGGPSASSMCSGNRCPSCFTSSGCSRLACKPERQAPRPRMFST